MKDTIDIEGKKLGKEQPTFIIAEAGVNHNGDMDLAKTLVLEASKAGADCVKFQTFEAARVVTSNAPKARYQLETTDPVETQIEMLRKLELNVEQHRELIQFSRDNGIIFLSTPYNEEDCDLLESLGVSAYKLASISCAEPSFLKYVGSKKKPVILSTGMATLSEVDQAISIYKTIGNESLAILQCTTNYPSHPEDANISAMYTMKNAFQVMVGYSDHMQTDIGCIMSIALGADIIEKHFTLDKSFPGPDHSSSATPSEFAEMVKRIRAAEDAVGTGIKEPAEVEKVNSVGMRRSIVLRKRIEKGGLFTLEHLTLKRPATGISPQMYDVVIGKKATGSLREDRILQMRDVEW